MLINTSSKLSRTPTTSVADPFWSADHCLKTFDLASKPLKFSLLISLDHFCRVVVFSQSRRILCSGHVLLGPCAKMEFYQMNFTPLITVAAANKPTENHFYRL